MGSLPIIIFVVFLVAISALGAFLDMLAKMAARAEQERRARAREEQQRLRPPQTTQQVHRAAPPPPPPRPAKSDEEMLRELLMLDEPQRPAPRPAPRPVPVARPVVRKPARPAPAGAPGSLSKHHLDAGLSDHHLAPTASVFGTGPTTQQRVAPTAAVEPTAHGLSALDGLSPLARAFVLTEVFGKPLAARPRQLHRTRAV